MQAMPWFSSSDAQNTESDEDMDPFPECANCINKELDPFQCETCEDACNYEPYEDEDDDEGESMTIAEFKEFWGRYA